MIMKLFKTLHKIAFNFIIFEDFYFCVCSLRLKYRNFEFLSMYLIDMTFSWSPGPFLISMNIDTD